jgi:hypothetical protein
MREYAILLQPQFSPDVECGEEHLLTTLATHLPRNRVGLRCQVLFKYIWPNYMASINITPNVNQKTAVIACFCGCMGIIK